jgi:alkanesulfonate monooxygenase SsuD/methylene tetrahydromethanopterin reductase-like flavin-dependent oxidoreductase (luciferase family)
MVAISIMIEGQNGVSWPRWKRMVAAVEELGFAGLFRSDHFTNPQPPDRDSLEMVVSLAYVAASTERIHFGPLVAPVSFRDPVMLLRQAAALDDLSGGRMILGLGAGWQAREHTLYGYDLGDVPERVARLEEALEVVTRLRRGAETAYSGRFFHLGEGATIQPKRLGGPALCVGGNGARRTLPLAARYADIWNGVFLTPEKFGELSQTLDGLLREQGRQPGDVKRTLMTGMHFGRDRAELERAFKWTKDEPEYAGLSLDQVVDKFDKESSSLAGTPEMFADKVKAYAAAGCEELMLQWWYLDDLDWLRGFAESVLPRL